MKKKVSLSDLKFGYELEEDIKTENGKILVKKGTILTESLIARLRQWNNRSNCMIVIDDFNSVENENERQKRIENSLKKIFIASVGEVGSALSELESYLAHIYDDLKTIEDLSEDITKIRFSSSRGGHYFRIAKMSVALANLYNKEVSDDKKLSISSVALAALLHDYGMRFKNDSESLSRLKIDKKDKESNAMLSIPYKGEHKPGYSRLSVRDIINGPYEDRYHTVYAYVALKDKVPEDVRDIILYSANTKEAFQNRKFNKVVKMANIIGMCDAYDTLLEYVIKEDMNSPFENVISYMSQCAHNGSLDNELFELFLRHVTIYPTGVKVLLSNDQYAVVVRKSSDFPTKPLVLTLAPSVPTLIDLAETTNITIRRIVKKEDEVSAKVDAIQKEQLNGLTDCAEENISPDSTTPDVLVLKKGEKDQAKILGKRFLGFLENK